MVGLSAVLSGAERIARWLDADLLQTQERPVELRKGILCGQKYTYREHNSQMDGKEKLVPAALRR